MSGRTVHVQLLGEPIDIWRPVEAELESDDVFRLVDRAPEGEVWQFPPGSRVGCELRQLADGDALVASELVP
jgi:hypothetical protein